MKDIKVTGRIEFLQEENKRYNRTFVASLEKSCAFQYGNGTCVIIEFGRTADGHSPEGKYIDTRYDRTISDNEKLFKKWLEGWFELNYCDHKLIFD